MKETLSGVAGWLIGKWRGRKQVEPRLVLVERIALGPRQWLALVEAEGRRILVTSSAEGGSALYPLDGEGRGGGRERADAQRTRKTIEPAARISW
jgi:hypothetical protein